MGDQKSPLHENGALRGGSVKSRCREEMGWVEWDRAELDELADEMSRYEFVLRFTLSHAACDTIVIGTTDVDHLRAKTAVVQVVPLQLYIYEEAKKRLAELSRVQGIL